MGIFDLFAKPPARLAAGRGWTFDIVGESQFQENLSRLAGGPTREGHNLKCTATLQRDARNREDPNAVLIQISGEPVGFLSRERAAEFCRALPDRKFRCEAKICGGWDRGTEDRGHFGVKLNLRWPPTLDVSQA